MSHNHGNNKKIRRKHKQKKSDQQTERNIAFWYMHACKAYVCELLLELVLADPELLVLTRLLEVCNKRAVARNHEIMTITRADSEELNDEDDVTNLRLLRCAVA